MGANGNRNKQCTEAEAEAIAEAEAATAAAAGEAACTGASARRQDVYQTESVADKQQQAKQPKTNATIHKKGRERETR